MVIAKELELFKEEKQHSFYEKCCKFVEKIPIPILSKDLEKKYQEAIDFANLDISARSPFSLTIFVVVMFTLISFSLLYSLHALSAASYILIFAFDIFIFYYMYKYPFIYATHFRIKASSEMVLTIIYMTISMRITPNLENAIKFAASNLRGPLAYDLKKMIWDVYTRKYDSISDALDKFSEKWKRENEEFVAAINIIQTSFFESHVKREEALDEAVSVIISGTKERMTTYARDLKTPVTVINSMGILLPIIGLVFFPMISIFLPNIIKPIFLGVGYCVILPMMVYWMMENALQKRPYSFYQPDISKHPKFIHEKFINKILILSLIISILPSSIALAKIYLSTEIFSFNLLLYSLIITISLAGGVIFYFFFTVTNKLKIREEVINIEREFAEVLYQLGGQLARGVPIEKALGTVTKKISDLKISKLFESILKNIETFGMTLEQAIFDKEMGAIKAYPSKTIEAVFKAIVEISERGMAPTAKAMISISSYLKDLHSVEEHLKDDLSEVTSTMQMQSYLLAPLTAGIVVSMTAVIMRMLLLFSEAVKRIQERLVESGIPGQTGNLVLNSLIDINSLIPVEWFQLIVGIYMIEIVMMLASFTSTINEGEENLMKKHSISVMLSVSILIYFILVVIIYLVFDSILPSVMSAFA